MNMLFFHSLGRFQAVVLCGMLALTSLPQGALAQGTAQDIATNATDDALSICPDKAGDTVIHVALEMPEPAINHIKTRADLRNFSVSTKSPYGGENSTHVNGLMRGPVELKTNLTLAWQSNASVHQNCFWYRTVNLTLSLDPTIFVASEIPNDVCYYNAIIEHEMKHVEVDRGLIRDYQNILYDTVENFVREHGTIDRSPFGDEAVAQKQLMKSMEGIVKEVHHRMREDRIERQAKIDTLQEYNRVSEQCASERFF